MDKLLGLDIGNELENQTGGLGDLVTNNIKELDDVGAAIKGLENLRLTVDFFNSDRLEDLNNTLFIVCRVNTLVDLRVLTTAEFLKTGVRIQGVPVDVIFVVERVVMGTIGAHLFIGAFKLVGHSDRGKFCCRRFRVYHL